MGIRKKLEKFGQQHLLQFVNELNNVEKEQLLQEINSIDFNFTQELYKKTLEPNIHTIDDITPLHNVYIKDDMESDLKDCWKNIGTHAIKSNKYAVLTMAGGQGTRLGHVGPKGTYMLNIGKISKSIFELLIDKLKKAQDLYGVTIPWYIMTSEENHNETVSFFEQNNYFNYGKDNIIFFKQNTLPMLDEQGKIILESKYHIKLASDGNGGVFKALYPYVINDMERRGIEWVYISGVDNILVNFVDEVFLGGTINLKVDIASKSVLKKNPDEKVGVICKKNNKPHVIEYTEIPKNMLDLRKDNGELVLAEANIVSNIYSMKLLKRLVDIPLSYHIAKKKCDVLKETGNIEVAIKPNAYKFETFIFDSYSYVDDVFVLRVEREKEFAPIKNKEGEDSPQTASILYEKAYKKDSE